VTDGIVRWKLVLGIVVYIYNPIYLEAETGGSRFKAIWGKKSTKLSQKQAGYGGSCL
jgi:hypothetical protein